MKIPILSRSDGSFVPGVGGHAGRPEYRDAEATTPKRMPVSTYLPQSAVWLSVAGQLPTITVLRAGLVLCSVAAAAIAWFIASGSSQSAEPELALLMRGMAAVKFLFSVAAAGLAWWRLGQPVSVRVAAAYIGCVSAFCTSAVLIWQLSFIPVAALLFHVAGLVALIAAFREGHFVSRHAYSKSVGARRVSRQLNSECRRSVQQCDAVSSNSRPNPRFERTRSIWLRQASISFWAWRSQMKRAAQPKR